MKIKKEILKAIGDLTTPAFFKGAFNKFFSWKDLENLLNLRPFVNASRFNILSGQTYQWRSENWMSDINSFPPSLIDTEIRKHHCYFTDGSRVNKSINEVCGQLEKQFNSCADAHIYFNLSEDNNHPFKIHWDQSHNLILQMEGSTHFEAWSQKIQVKEKNLDSLSEEPVISEILTPGDAVFVPSHTYHRATSVTKRLSISFPFVIDITMPAQDRHWIRI